MTTITLDAGESTSSASSDEGPERWDRWVGGVDVRPELGLVEPLTVPAVAESAEAVIEGLDAPRVAAPCIEGAVVGAGMHEDPPISVDEYAKAVLYNGLGHYQAARAAAERACERDDFVLLEGALGELVEASVRSDSRRCATAALRRLEALARVSGSAWARGVAACSRALLSDDELAERSYLEAIALLGRAPARVALARVQLLYGEWLRRQGRRVDAREQLCLAQRTFCEVGMVGFEERARRELLATGRTVRKRTDDTRLDLTPQEAQIAQFAADGATNPEIGRRLFLSPRTVEWHLRKVFNKLGVRSRRELNARLPRVPHLTASA
jgi:DNA-binding CsgD family transcriptional regulator